MFPLEQYRADALAMGPEPFGERHGRYFFVHISSKGIASPEDPQWMTMNLSEFARVAVTTEEQVSWAVSIQKRPGNPEPDRISVGRARSCDIVLRYPYISKIHAVVLEKDDRHSLMDMGSSNGTRVNGVELDKGGKVRLELGDTVQFGELELRYVSARVFHAQLRAPKPPASSRAFGSGIFSR